MVESDQWRRARLVEVPTNIVGAGIAYDEMREKVVLFGGLKTGYSAQTWEWDGSAWRLRATIDAPSARMTTMTYDSVRKRVVLFGGGLYMQGRFDDTWEWDGYRWTKMNPTVSPPARIYHAMAFDARRGRVVMFGGEGSGGIVLGDLWEYDGTTWTQITPATGPSARTSAALAYDANRGVVVLFGGSAAQMGTYDATAWEWDGTTWTQGLSLPDGGRRQHTLVYVPARNGVVVMGGYRYAGFPVPSTYDDFWAWDGAAWTSGTGGCGPRSGHATAYDAARGRIVTTGGTHFASLVFGTHEWTGSAWVDRTPRTWPLARSGHAMAFDSARAETLMFGGQSSAGLSAETWTWTGSQWIERAPIDSPTPRVGHSMADDRVRGRVVMFGGTSLADTWEWDGTNWIFSNPTASPPPREGAAMAFDPVRGHVILFGGRAVPSGTVLADTWEWDGTTWQPLSPAVSPPPRVGHVMQFDAARRRVVLFGGLRGNLFFDDTWEWDGVTWTQRATTVAPPAVAHAVAVYDTVRQVVVVAGGNLGGNGTGVRADTTWEWDGSSWTLRDPGAFDARANGAASYDELHRQIVMFGGADSQPTPVTLDDTWLRMFVGTSDICVRDDTDGDGLAGCLDPDCAGRCTPGCIPGDSCNPASPHCGDGICSTVEDYGICPGDC